MKKNHIFTVVSAALILTLGSPAQAHDKCDSLSMAATAGGAIWAPVAGFQVGYFVAKFIDESTSQSISPSNFMRCRKIELSREQYRSLFPDAPMADEFKFVWDGAGDLIERSRRVAQAVSTWQTARQILSRARDRRTRMYYSQVMNAAHAGGMNAFEEYRKEHIRFAATLREASRLLAAAGDEIGYEPMTVQDVVAMAREVASGTLPEFERRYLIEIACLDPSVINAQGVLAPAARFIDGTRPPGTFISDEDLKSLDKLYAEISSTFGTEVVQRLEHILPPEFVANEPVAFESLAMEEDLDKPEVSCTVGDNRGSGWLAVVMLALGVGLGRQLRRPTRATTTPV